MNDHFGMIVHSERTRQWRHDADDSRLLAQAKAERQSPGRGERPPRLAIAQRLLAAAAGRLPGRLKAVRPRAARGAVIAMALALIVAAPAAAATPPTRAVTYPQGWFAPAGQACTFDVRGVPTSGFEATTVFDDNHWMRSVRVKGYYENLVTHKTYWVNDTWTEDDAYDATTNILTIKGTGQIDVPFWPGDASPFGGIVTTAAYYRFAGTTVNVVDFNGVPRTAEFTWSGRITDICAALS